MELTSQITVVSHSLHRFEIVNTASKQPKKKSSPQPRKRRASLEVKQLVRDSALTLFSTRGYSGSTTRAIAEAAGVTEQILFRHYRSKRELFREVIWIPFSEILRDHADVASRFPDTESMTDRANGYVDTLYKQLRRDREFFRAFLISVQTEPELQELVAQPDSPLAMFFSTLAKYTRASASELRPGLDPELAVRMTFSYIVAMTVFDDIYFTGRKPSSSHLLSEMKAFMTDGISPHGRVPASRPPSQSRPQKKRSRP
jgi:AcrR family transcriptional regulator